MKRELINYCKVADFAVSIWPLFNRSLCSVDDFAFNQQNEFGNIIIKLNRELYMSWKTWNNMGCLGNSLCSPGKLGFCPGILNLPSIPK